MLRKKSLCMRNLPSQSTQEFWKMLLAKIIVQRVSLSRKPAETPPPLKWSYRRFKSKEAVWGAKPGYKTGLTAADAFLLFARVARLPTEVNPPGFGAKKFPKPASPAHKENSTSGHGTGGSRRWRTRGRKTTWQIIINEPTAEPLHGVVYREIPVPAGRVRLSQLDLLLYRSHLNPHRSQFKVRLYLPTNPLLSRPIFAKPFFGENKT